MTVADAAAAETAARVDPVVGTLQTTRRLLWLMVVPVLLLLGVLTAVQFHQRMQDAERELLRRADERAQELEAIVRPAMAHVRDLRAMLEARWPAPPDFGPGLRRTLAPHHRGWSLDTATAAQRAQFGQIWWAEPDGRPPAERWLRLAQAFVEQARIVHERAPGFEATWFAAADTNTSFGYPWLDTAQMMRSMGATTLLDIAEPRRRGVERARLQLARDPNDLVFWGLPYVSQLNGELVMSHGAKLIIDGDYRGEVSLDFRLDELQRRVAQWQAARGAQGRIWIVDARQNVLADSAQPLHGPIGQGLADTVVRLPLAERLPAGLGRVDVDGSLFQPEAVRHGEGWALLAAVRIGSPWTYVQAVPEAALRAQVLPSLLPNALLALALLAMFVGGQWLMTRHFVRPAVGVLAYLRRLSSQPDEPAPDFGRRWRGWVEAVTETFRRQRELQQRERQTEALKAAIIDHAINAIVSTDAQGHVVEFNPAAEAMFGIARADALGRPIGDLIVPERLRAAHENGMKRLADGGEERMTRQRLQMQALRADGSEFPIEMVLFRTELEGLVHYTASISDHSEHRAAAEQIERQRDALRQSEKLSAMGSLLAGVAHELNNPLAIVMGRASLLEEKAGTDSDLAPDARRIREAAERCGRIVRTFLNMARSRPSQRSSVGLNPLAQAAADMLAYTMRSHGIVLDLQLAEDLPEVMADADQIGQVLLNLLVNAQQALATHDGPRHLTLTTGVETRRPAREPRVWLRVQDSGPGVPTHLRETIFAPFFTTKPDGLGTGMGLAVSRGLMREHGGELLLEPDTDGASFRLSLPISGQAEAVSQPMALDPLSASALARLLVVDDEPEIADLMRDMLEGAGYEVAVAESGAIALELLAEARFDAIVSDLRMPEMDGAALWRTVRDRAPLLARRMLFVTGDTLSAGARQFLDDARVPRLEKPFAKGELLAAVAALLAD